MPENDDLDPAASTQMFQAFVDRADEDDERSSWWIRVVVAAIALAVLAFVVVLAWAVLG